MFLEVAFESGFVGAVRTGERAFSCMGEQMTFTVLFLVASIKQLGTPRTLDARALQDNRRLSSDVPPSQQVKPRKHAI